MAKWIRTKRAEKRQPDWIVTTVAFPPELYRRLKHVAVDRRFAVAEAIRQAVAAWIREAKRED